MERREEWRGWKRWKGRRGRKRWRGKKGWEDGAGEKDGYDGKGGENGRDLPLNEWVDVMDRKEGGMEERRLKGMERGTIFVLSFSMRMSIKEC